MHGTRARSYQLTEFEDRFVVGGRDTEGRGDDDPSGSGVPIEQHPSVVIVDLGRAYVCLEPEDMARELGASLN